MLWTVIFHEKFDAEVEKLPATVRRELLATARLLKDEGPQLGRPHADTLNGSDHANMKRTAV
jgi:hypothetical protein